MNTDLTPNIDIIDLKGCEVDFKSGSIIKLIVCKGENEIVEEYDPRGISEVRKRLNRGDGNYIEDRIKLFVDTLNSVK